MSMVITLRMSLTKYQTSTISINGSENFLLFPTSAPNHGSRGAYDYELKTLLPEFLSHSGSNGKTQLWCWLALNRHQLNFKKQIKKTSQCTGSFIVWERKGSESIWNWNSLLQKFSGLLTKEHNHPHSQCFHLPRLYIWPGWEPDTSTGSTVAKESIDACLQQPKNNPFVKDSFEQTKRLQHSSIVPYLHHFPAFSAIDTYIPLSCDESRV